ncbi:AbrB/MazE/SpoVT family DNA-binding domain-containing protein [Candidatus Woesearchaeota archaeon]|nr:AbrB/MazE/SpoVT family DNA-binding domain-containing protein [Candidatus Woesearchaeota archaeon]
MEIGITKLSTRGQIVIPNNIRDHLGLTENDQLVIMSDDNEIVIKPVKDILNIDRKKSRFARDFVRAMRHDKILQDMEEGKELDAEEVLK